MRGYAFDWAMGWERDANVLKTPLEPILKAVGVDERLALTHAVLGWVQRRRGQFRLRSCNPPETADLSRHGAASPVWLTGAVLTAARMRR